MMQGINLGALGRGWNDAVIDEAAEAAPSEIAQTMVRLLGILLLTFGVLQLGFRGMQRVRSDIPLWDFVSVHAAVRTWIGGGDPYDLKAVTETWGREGIFADRDVSYFATVYPPTSLFMIIPLALLPAIAAMGAWLAIMLALLAFQFRALAELARIYWHDGRFLLLVGAAVASAPLQFGILSGQLSIPAIALCIIALSLAQNERDVLAGILLGLACGLKPQVAGAFVAYYLVVRRFKLAGVAIAVGSAIGVMALAAMKLTHINWVTGWKQSILATQVLNAVNDYGWGNKFRDEIIDLKMLLVSAIHDPQMLKLAIGVIVLGLLAWYAFVFFKRRWTGVNELLPLAGLAAISLLPIYHRVYDVTLLTLALAWAIAQLGGPRRGLAWAMLIPMAVFLIPFDVVKSIGNRAPGMIQRAQTPWWQTWFAPHYAWGLLATTLIILAAMQRLTRLPQQEESELAEAIVP
jgi:hypothetical protein